MRIKEQQSILLRQTWTVPAADVAATRIESVRLQNSSSDYRVAQNKISLADKNPPVKIVIFMVNVLHGSVVA